MEWLEAIRRPGLLVHNIGLACGVLMLGCVVACAGDEAPRAERPEASTRVDPVSRMFLSPFIGDYATPADAGLAIEEVRLTNVGGENLRAWYMPRPGATHTILFCMGNTGNISAMLPYAKILLDGGFNVLMFDYQGFGESTGTATAMSLPGDALAAFDYLTNERGVPAAKIGVFGVSLGSALAIAVAAERGAGAVAVEDLLLPGREIERLRRRREIPEDVPTTLAIAAIETLVLPKVDPLMNIPKLKCPLFLMHGENDRLLTPDSTVDAAAVATVPLQVWLMQGVGHAPETLEVNDLEYASQLQTFFADAFARNVRTPVVRHSAVPVDQQWNVTVDLELPEAGPWQICLFAPSAAEEWFSTRRFHFERRVCAKQETLTVLAPFKPTHISAIAFQHVELEGDAAWRPKLSHLSQCLADVRAFRDEAIYGQPMQWFAEPHRSGISTQSYRTREHWQLIRARLPAPETIHPQVRPRYAMCLADLPGSLSPRDRNVIPEIIREMEKYLPEQPERHVMLDNAYFHVGLKHRGVASVYVFAAAELWKTGEVNACRTLLRNALLYSPWPEFTAGKIESLQPDSDFFFHLGILPQPGVMVP